MTSPQMRTSVRERYAEAAIGFDKLLAPEDQKGAIEALPPACRFLFEDEYFENLRQHVLEAQEEESTINVSRMSSEDNS